MKLHPISREGRTVGYMISCPGCRGHHALWVEPHRPGAYAWQFNGNPESPTFHPSFKVTWTEPSGPKVCHFHVREGRIDFCQDSTHAMAGKSAPLEDF
jgi:hypothetical protein